MYSRLESTRRGSLLLAHYQHRRIAKEITVRVVQGFIFFSVHLSENNTNTVSDRIIEAAGFSKGLKDRRSFEGGDYSITYGMWHFDVLCHKDELAL